MFKNLISKRREYIFIILTATIFSLFLFSKSYSDENVFIVNDVKVEGTVDVNFSRDRYINKAFKDSFKMLTSKILLSRDLNKLDNTNLKQIRNLIKSFQILEENYRNERYEANFKIVYNEAKVKKLLGSNNISFTEPKNISAVFFPILFVDEEFLDFNDNYFYKNWIKFKIQNESINFILPLEDLDDISKIKKMKNQIEEFELKKLVNKYNTKNYIFALMSFQEKKLNVFLKCNFNDNKIGKNFSYDLNNLQDDKKLNLILKKLKIQINDLWKEENIINVAIPLTIKIKFQHKKLQDLDRLKKIFREISIIDNSILEKFDINNSIFKIYYYGNPKKLKNELLRFNYQLVNNQGFWELRVNG